MSSKGNVIPNLNPYLESDANPNSPSEANGNRIKISRINRKKHLGFSSMRKGESGKQKEAFIEAE